MPQRERYMNREDRDALARARRSLTESLTADAFSRDQPTQCATIAAAALLIGDAIDRLRHSFDARDAQ